MMQIELAPDEVEVLRDLLESDLTDIRIESARADASEFRGALRRREDIVRHILALIGGAPAALRRGEI